MSLEEIVGLSHQDVGFLRQKHCSQGIGGHVVIIFQFFLEMLLTTPTRFGILFLALQKCTRQMVDMED